MFVTNRKILSEVLKTLSSLESRISSLENRMRNVELGKVDDVRFDSRISDLFEAFRDNLITIKAITDYFELNIKDEPAKRVIVPKEKI